MTGPGAYLDCAATTPVRPEVVAAMAPFLAETFANPSGAHLLAREARGAVEDAREELAELLGAAPGEVVFTSGGTEADNLAVFGVQRRCGGTVLCSSIEHHAVLETVEVLGGGTVPVDDRGMVDLDGLAAILEHSPVPTSLVSVMLVNNEVGVVQPLEEVADVLHRVAPGAVLHTDAVQAFTWLDVAELARPAQLISISAHKFGGPKGVGALVVREGVEIEPLLRGGGQERGRRSGTHYVAGIVGMAAAAREAERGRKQCVERLGGLRDRLADGLRSAIPDVVETGVHDSDAGPDRSHHVAGICHLCFRGIESESLLFLLEKEGVYASAASSCASGAMEPSHVLAAMGIPRELAFGSLRLSLGWCSTESDVERALEVIPRAVEHLRRFS